MSKEIQLTQEYVAIVDDEDFEWLSQWKWRYHGGYAVRGTRKDGIYERFSIHRVIMDTPKGMVTDHINHNGLDNRKENLRICTQTENGRNRTSAKNSTSRYLGVSYDKHIGKFKSQITINGVLKYLGIFVYEEDAARAYNNAAIDHFGDYKNLNEIY